MTLNNLIYFLFFIFFLFFFPSQCRQFAFVTEKVWYKGELIPIGLHALQISNSSHIYDVKLLISDPGFQKLKLESYTLLNGSLNEVLKVDESWDHPKLWLNVSIQERGGSEEVFSEGTQVLIKKAPNFVHIQFDKPLYKPGDLIKIRVLDIEGKGMKPSNSTNLKKALIKNLESNVIKQWLEPQAHMGLYEFEMSLSPRARTEEYKFCVFILNKEHCEPFRVEKYVLPRFSSSIEVNPPKIPWHLAYDSNLLKKVFTFEVKVCAQYTFGGPLHGSVRISLDENHEQLLKLKADGCASLVTSIHNWKKNPKITGKVIEEGTDSFQPFEHEISKAQRAIHLAPVCQKEFVSGLPYHCFGWLKSENQKPVPNENLEIKNHKGLKIISKTDENGFFQFSINQNLTFSQDTFLLQLNSELNDVTYGQLTLVSKDVSKDAHIYISSLSFLDQMKNETKSKINTSYPINLEFTLASWEPVSTTTFHFVYMIKIEDQLVLVKTFQPSLKSVETEDLYEVEDEPEKHIFSDLYNKINKKTIHLYKFREAFYIPEAEGVAQLILLHQTPHELLSTEISFEAESSQENKAHIKFVDTRLKPGDETTLKLSAPPESLCAVSVVDKSLKLLEDKPRDLKHDKVFSYKKEFKTSIFEKDKCVKNGKVVEGHALRNSPTYNLIKYFQMRGLRLLINKKYSLPNCEVPIYYDYGYDYEDIGRVSGPMSGQNFNNVNIMRRTGITEYQNSLDMYEMDDFEEAEEAGKEEETVEFQHRDIFPESWLFFLYQLGQEESDKRVNLTAPHTVTSWLGNGYCLNKREGVLISDDFSMTTFKNFFVEFSLPYSLIRSEIVTIPISIFNYLKKCVQVTVEIEKNSGFELKKRHLVDWEFQMCKEYHSFNVTLIARMLGNINFTVKATGIPVEEANKVIIDQVTRNILVEPEGRMAEVQNTTLVCAPASGNLEIDYPKEFVRGSLKYQASISGDMIGPSLANINSLVRLPSGCGEQNMVNFVPNIYIMDYIVHREQIQPDEKSAFRILKEKAIKYLERGYQGELSYLHKDGSYSAFGNGEGSLWLTAFVVKSFFQAKKHIFIDEAIIHKNLQFIKRHQTFNGCFPEVGYVFDKELMGGMRSGPSNDYFDDDFLLDDEEVSSGKKAPAKNFSLAYNSYVVSALVETSNNLDSPEIKKGLQCLKSLSSGQSEDFYEQVLLLYTYSLLSNHSIHSNLYFKQLQVVEKIFKEDLKGVTKSHILEMKAYYLISLLNHPTPDLTTCRALAQWIAKQRNSIGGYHSTQDTVLALQALAMFQTLFDEEVDVKVKLMDLEEISINQTNKILHHSFENISFHKKPMPYKVSGKGCVLLQAAISYHEEFFNGDQHKIDVFNMSVGIKHDPISCKKKILHICFIYNGEGESTNMGVLVVNLPTGWVPDIKSLDKLEMRIGLKKYEYEKGKVTFYYDSVTKTEYCLHFNVLRFLSIENQKPAIVELYDYYNPDLYSYAEYMIPQHCRSFTGRMIGNERERDTIFSDPEIEDYYTEDKEEVPSKNCPTLIKNQVSYLDLMQACKLTNNYKVDLTKGRFGELISSSQSQNTTKQIRVRLSKDCSDSLPQKTLIINTNSKLRQPNNRSVISVSKKDSVFVLDSDVQYHNIEALVNGEQKAKFCKEEFNL